MINNDPNNYGLTAFAPSWYYRNNLKEHKRFDWRNWSIVPIEEKYWKIIKKI